MSLLDITMGYRLVPAPAIQLPHVTFGQAFSGIARARYGALSTRQIAEIALVTPETLRRWTNGGMPPLIGLRWAAKRLGLDAHAFDSFRRPAAA